MTTSNSSKRETAPFPKGVSRPAIRGLDSAGFTHFEQLAGLAESELAKLHGVGPKALRIIQQALIDAGLNPMKP